MPTRGTRKSYSVSEPNTSTPEMKADVIRKGRQITLYYNMNMNIS